MLNDLKYIEKGNLVIIPLQNKRCEMYPRSRPLQFPQGLGAAAVR